EFRTWFNQVTPLGFVDGAFVMGVPHTFARDWLRSKYTHVLELALAELGAQPPRVAFQVTGPKNAEQQDLFGGVLGTDQPPAPSRRRLVRRTTRSSSTGSPGSARRT